MTVARLTLAIAVVLGATDAAASPDDAPPPGPAFELRLELDAPLLAIGVVFAGAWYLHGELAPAYCAPRCDPARINAFDRTVAGRWSPGWSRAGDVGALGSVLGPAAALLLAERPAAAGRDLIVIAESVLLTSTVATIAQMALRRPRPFLYGDAAPDSARDDGNGGLSFVSGHTAIGFAATVATFQALGRLEPGSRRRIWYLGAGLATASFVGVTRLASGNHFPTDVLAGAAIGTAMGLLVPSLHRRGVAITPSANDEQATLSVAARF